MSNHPMISFGLFLLLWVAGCSQDSSESAPPAAVDETESVGEPTEPSLEGNPDPPSEVSCMYSDPGSDPAEPGGTPAAVAKPQGVTGEEPFDELDLRLAVNATTVPAGCEVTGWLLLANRSGAPVIEPSCELGLGRYAIIPVDDPDAELWVTPIADCEGDREIAEGFEGEHGWFEFFAATQFGEPLPPGDYVAALEIDGWSGRFELPITVEP